MSEIGGQWSGQAGDRQSYILSAFFSREGRKGREEDLNRVCPWPGLAVCDGFSPWARTGRAGRPSRTGAGKTGRVTCQLEPANALCRKNAPGA